MTAERPTPGTVNPSTPSEPHGSGSESGVFVLDLDSNPHPRMLKGAIDARGHAFARDTQYARGFWQGYLEAMADATGCEKDDLEAWLDRHEHEL